MAIERTPTAADEVRRLLRGHELDEHTEGLRLGGTGFGPKRQFTLDLAAPYPRQETVAESRGIRISIDPSDEPELDGVTIRFRDVGGVRGFSFDLPSTDVSRQARRAVAARPAPDEPQVRQALRAVIDPVLVLELLEDQAGEGLGRS